MMKPPMVGWKSTNNTGKDISPSRSLCCHGSIAAFGHEHNTGVHRVAEWTIENKMLELAFGKSHRIPKVWCTGLLLMEFVAKVGTRGNERDDGYLKAPHVLMV